MLCTNITNYKTGPLGLLTCSWDMKRRSADSHLVACVAYYRLGMGMVRSARLACQAIRLVTASTHAQP